MGFFLTGKPENSREVGISITLMASLCLLGGIWGVHLRVGSPLKCVVVGCTEPPTQYTSEMRLPTDEKDASRLASLVAIRAELTHIEMPLEERKELFQAALKDKDGLSAVRDILHEVTTGKKLAPFRLRIKIRTRYAECNNCFSTLPRHQRDGDACGSDGGRCQTCDLFENQRVIRETQSRA